MNFDPRTNVAIKDLPFDNLFMMTWNAIMSSNFTTAPTLSNLFLDTIADLFVIDALERNGHGIVTIHIMNMVIDEVKTLKISITETGNRPDILSVANIEKSGFKEDVLQKGTSGEKKVRTNIALRALESIGGSFRQSIKTPESDNLLELFIPIKVESYLKLAVNNNDLADLDSSKGKR